MNDLTQYKERHLRVVDAAETFDGALARAVQIVDTEGFMEPCIEVKPCWTWDDDGSYMHYTVIVYGCLARGAES